MKLVVIGDKQTSYGLTLSNLMICQGLVSIEISNPYLKIEKYSGFKLELFQILLMKIEFLQDDFFYDEVVQSLKSKISV